MLNYQKTGKLLSEKRKHLGLTQKQLADQLGISFQAVSRWENGLAMPSIELLEQLSILFSLSIDEIIKGEPQTEEFSYYHSGIDFSLIDLINKDLNYPINAHKICQKKNAFRGSLYDLQTFSMMSHPILVSKVQEPGTKQKLALKYGYHKELIEDIIHNLINDIIMTGAKPLFICPSIIGGKTERDFVVQTISLFRKIAEKYRIEIAKSQTSTQPHIMASGDYFINAVMIGIVNEPDILDARNIQEGDIVLGIKASGLHHYGYSLIYDLLEKRPWLKSEKIHGINLLDELMKPQYCYYLCLRDLMNEKKIKAAVNIIGGGIPRHASRITPQGLSTCIDLEKINVLPVFKYLKRQLNISETEMLHTFNCGVGMMIVVAKENKDMVLHHIQSCFDCTEIGNIILGNEPLILKNHLRWS